MHRTSSLTLNQLEVFAAVAREGSFTRAGEVLMRSEAAISQQIRLLEATAGARLFERSPGGRPVRLTEAGRVMLASCEAILGRLDQTVRDLDALVKFESGTVVVGAGPYFGSYILPKICASFHRLAPGVGIRLHTAKALDCVEALRRGIVELAIVAGQVDGTDVSRAHLVGRDMVWIAPAGHRLVRRPLVPFAEIAAENIVVASRRSSGRVLLERWASDHGVELRPSLEVGGIEAQVTAVQAGLGLAAVPSHILSRYQDAPLGVLSVEGFPLRGSWTIVWRRGELSPAAKAFKGHLIGQRSSIESDSLYRGPTVGHPRHLLARPS